MNDNNLYIDKLPKLCPNLQLVSIYNMDGCSGVENIYKISNKSLTLFVKFSISDMVKLLIAFKVLITSLTLLEIL